jgi:hypothetical protein
VAATITWKFSGITAEDGYYLARLFFVTNETRVGDDVRLKDVSISGGWTFDGPSSISAPVLETSGDYEAYYINPTDYTEISNAIPVYRGTRAADSLYITLNVDCYLESGDSISITIYVDWVTAEGSIDQDSDAVNIDY